MVYASLSEEVEAVAAVVAAAAAAVGLTAERRIVIKVSLTLSVASLCSLCVTAAA